MSNCQGGTSAPRCSPQKLTSWNLWNGFARTSNTIMGMTTQGLSNKYCNVGLGWHCGVSMICSTTTTTMEQTNWHVKNNFLRVSLFVLSCPEAQNLVRYGLSRETHDKLQSPNPKAHNKWQSKEHPNSKDGGYVYYFIVFFFSFSNANVGSWQPFKGGRWVLFVFSHNVKACKVYIFLKVCQHLGWCKEQPQQQQPLLLFIANRGRLDVWTLFALISSKIATGLQWIFYTQKNSPFVPKTINKLLQVGWLWIHPYCDGRRVVLWFSFHLVDTWYNSRAFHSINQHEWHYT